MIFVIHALNAIFVNLPLKVGHGWVFILHVLHGCNSICMLCFIINCCDAISRSVGSCPGPHGQYLLTLAPPDLVIPSSSFIQYAFTYSKKGLNWKSLADSSLHPTCSRLITSLFNKLIVSLVRLFTLGHRDCKYGIVIKMWSLQSTFQHWNYVSCYKWTERNNTNFNISKLLLFPFHSNAYNTLKPKDIDAYKNVFS